jgi:endonuclease-3
MDPAVTLYDALAEDLAAEASGSTPAPRRSKRIKVEAGETSPMNSSTEDFRAAARKSGRPTKRVKVERMTDANTEDEAKRRTKPSRPKAPKKPKSIPQSLEKPHPAPEHWREQYGVIKSMRARLKAPVDTMGCDQAQNGETDPKVLICCKGLPLTNSVQNRRFATLVSLMLSSQTKDEITDAAISKLRAALGGSISIDGLIAADEPTISQAIDKVGFWRRKTGYLKKAAQKLRDDFDSDVPKTVDELCSLPGVGPKMAFLALQTAWKL